MKKSYLLFALAAFLLAFSGCGDDDEEQTKIDPNLLVGKNWLLTGLTVNGMNEYAQMAACSKDDFWVFRANKEFEWNEGATKCEPSDPQIVFSTTYSVSDNRLMLAGGTAIIEELTATSLRVKIEDGSDTEIYSFRPQ